MKHLEQLAAAMRVELRNQAEVIDQLRKELDLTRKSRDDWQTAAYRLQDLVAELES